MVYRQKGGLGMSNGVKYRLPAVPTLYAKLPKGAEGGKEFGRIIDLLLFHDSRIEGSTQTVVNDSAGDYAGLDSFIKSAKSKKPEMGYQYKFFPSPLSDNHRREIEHSLTTASEKRKSSKIKKWILVTPEDFTESATRKTGGDATWFSGLRDSLGLEFEIEHYGHTKLQYLFLRCPTLSLFYYPEIVQNGAAQAVAIQTTRAIYDANLLQAYGRVEFIGMSVYKEEAGKGVPLDQIYIPITAVPELADDSNEFVSRIRPLDFLAPGRHTIILGDPGSGKSTLISFLALVGKSQGLQTRCGYPVDDRLSIVVVLRRYADELKRDRNLSLLDYIVRTAQADFNIQDIDKQFFEYYLVSGQAVVLFDGIDELPTPSFKKLVRDRISSLSISFPGITTIVTSRIVGYDAAIRFKANGFDHFKIARLALVEIREFVDDWYRIRIDHPVEASQHAEDLHRVISNPQHTSIRELAGNPLLLTIIALVHRIDAVLPDERVVLYQKCTETLLNTWHKWKFRDDDEAIKGKVERRNRRRLEAIAYWMQCRSVGGKSVAVVSEPMLRDFLSTFIASSELAISDPDDARDLADEFLEFIKRRTGLLVEIGDKQYSFVHLTFQEYLTATYLISKGEHGGVDAIWSVIRQHRDNARWHEVIRLLVSSLKSNDSQAFFIDHFLSDDVPASIGQMTLIGGVLLDGIESAELRSRDIAEKLLAYSTSTTVPSDLSSINRVFLPWSNKSPENKVVVDSIINLAIKKAAWQQKISLALTAVALGMDGSKSIQSLGRVPKAGLFEQEVCRSIVLGGQAEPLQFSTKWAALWRINNLMSTHSAAQNLLSSALQGLCVCVMGRDSARVLFQRLMITIASPSYGPFSDLVANSIAISLSSTRYNTAEFFSWFEKVNFRRPPPQDNRSGRFIIRNAIRRIALRHKLSDGELSRSKGSSRSRVATNDSLEGRTPSGPRLSRSKIYRTIDGNPANFWNMLRGDDQFTTDICNIMLGGLGISASTQWGAALSESLFPLIPDYLASQFCLEKRRNLVDSFTSGNAVEADLYYAGWIIGIETWRIANIDDSQPLVLIDRILDLSSKIEHPALSMALFSYAHIARDEVLLTAISPRFETLGPEILLALQECDWLLEYDPEQSLATKSGAIRAKMAG
jgi:hypothetical protein